jgi:hypothetical protein
MPFQKGHKLARGSNGQLRRDLTVSLISQLNEIVTLPEGGGKRSKMDLVIGALIKNAIGGDNVAIKEIFDRLQGRVAQRIVGPDDGPVKIEFNTIEEVKAYLLERGIDVERLPNPMRYLEDQREG